MTHAALDLEAPTHKRKVWPSGTQRPLTSAAPYSDKEKASFVANAGPDQMEQPRGLVPLRYLLSLVARAQLWMVRP